MPHPLASSSTPQPRLSDSHNRLLEVFVDIPPSPVHSSNRMTPRKTAQATITPASSTPALAMSRPASSSQKRKHDVFVEIPSPLRRTPKNNVLSRPGSSNSSSSARRRNQVYVEIPASPFSIAKHMMKGTLNSGMRSSPLSTKAFNVNAPAGSPLKKLRLSGTMKTATKEHEASENDPYPNGHFNCHQCRKKLDNSHGLQCTVLYNKRCKGKYCKSCLRNRYGQDADAIKRRHCAADGRHASEETYQWMCPKCADACNCVRCRKAKGLPAIGKFQPPPLMTPSKAKIVASSSNAGIMPYYDPNIEPKVHVPCTKRPVREPKWTAVPTTFGRSEIEDRYFLREFVLRFSPLMRGVAVSCLEELDLFDCFSFQNAKVLIHGLLDLIAADAETEEARIIREALKKLSGAVPSPATLWARLKRLRDCLPDDFFVVRIPEPSPRPDYVEDEADDESEPMRRMRTRGAKKATEEDEVLDLDNGVAHSVQLLPCIIALCEGVLRGPSVRADIEEGGADVRGENRSYFAEVRKENERWAKERASLSFREEKGDDKDKRKDDTEKKGKTKGKEKDSERDKAYKDALIKHKAKLMVLENVHMLELQGATTRFGPLGRDSQGRVYYTASAFRRRDKRNKVKLPDEEDRTGLRKWGWFLAVWGRGGLAESTQRNDDDAERWWGFNDPSEIRQLAKWLAALEGVEGKDSVIEGPGDTRIKGGDFRQRKNEDGDVFAMGPPTEAQAKALVKGLNEYANLLEWRLKGGEVPA